MRKHLLILFLPFILAGKARAETAAAGYEGLAQWASFQQFMKNSQDEDRRRGRNYMLSGLLASVGGVVGYQSSEDVFSRSMYAIVQSVGVVAIGEGANSYWNGNRYSSFYYAVEGASLTPMQKSGLLKRFLEKEKEEEQSRRWIKVVTYSLLAVGNLYYASTEEDHEVRGVLHFLAATYTVLAFSFAF